MARKNEEASKSVAIRLPISVYSLFEEEARAQERTVSSLGKIAIARYLEEAIERSQKKPNRTVVKSRPKAEPEEKDDERFAD